MIAALAGGVGGAKLARGLAHLLGGEVSVIVNTGDDFDHFDLRICPDIDTVTYTLAGRANPETGWGQAGESWNFMDQMAALGGEDWFKLGDRDLALHVLRTRLLRQGMRLTEVTQRIAASFGISAALLPMTDDALHTKVRSAEGLLDFQEYFVRRRCEVAVQGVVFAGADTARATPEAMAALDRAEAIIICPSNPYLSIDPILAIADLRRRLTGKRVPRVAVSPIIGGQAVKGPAAKMMRELGHTVSSLGVAHKYQGLADALVIDTADAALQPDIEALGLRVMVTNTLMRSAEDSAALAASVLDFAHSLRR